MKSAAADLQMRHRAVHLLVNDAGVSVAGRFEETSDEDMEWLFGVNYWGVVNGCRAFLPLLRGQPGAHIVNVCSSFAWLGVPGKSAYASSKAAVRAFSESLRAELRGEVGVTLLFPGPVDTNLVRRGRSKSAAQRDAEARFLASRALPTERVAKRCLDGVARDKQGPRRGRARRPPVGGGRREERPARRRGPRPRRALGHHAESARDRLGARQGTAIHPHPRHSHVAEQLTEVEAVFPRGAVTGTRYPTAHMAALDSENR